MLSGMQYLGFTAEVQIYAVSARSCYLKPWGREIIRKTNIDLESAKARSDLWEAQRVQPSQIEKEQSGRGGYLGVKRSHELIKESVSRGWSDSTVGRAFIWVWSPLHISLHISLYGPWAPPGVTPEYKAKVSPEHPRCVTRPPKVPQNKQRKRKMFQEGPVGFVKK